MNKTINCALGISTWDLTKSSSILLLTSKSTQKLLRKFIQDHLRSLKVGDQHNHIKAFHSYDARHDQRFHTISIYWIMVAMTE
jgi:hypothetical protein